MDVLSKASVCGFSISGIAGSNPAEGMNVRLRRCLCRHRPCDELIVLLEELYCARARVFACVCLDICLILFDLKSQQ
jgi:hypothetical protein